jgi:MFS transporter, DHA1 family, tetracycline resistance protein
LYLLVPFFAISIGLSQANMTALISRSADRSVQGEVLGINGSVMALAQAIPPVISGVVAAYFEPHAPLLIAATLAVIAGLYFNNHLRGLRLAHS